MFYIPLNILPLDYQGQAMSVAKQLLQTGQSAASGLAAIGKGIGAIFLLFVIFYYISALLDGGKFQTKMLWPFVIYLMVCNFGLVASPVLSFVTTLQKGCIDHCVQLKTNLRAEADPSGETTSIWGLVMKKVNQDEVASGIVDNDEVAISLTEDIEVGNLDGSGGAASPTGGGGYSGGSGDPGSYSGSGGSSQKATKEKGLKGLGNQIAKTLKNWEQNIFGGFINVFSVSIPKAVNTIGVYVKWGFAALLASILQFICSAASLIMICFGGVMMAIIVAFGPITFAFGVFPGNGRVIGAWCIRLCQFALYSPLAYLIDAFNMSIFTHITLQSGSEVLMTVAILLCNIACLFSIPGIAAMIIEGASGSISLSQGLSSMSTWGSSAMRIAMGPSGIAQWAMDLGERGRDKSQMEILRSINDATGGNPEYGLNSKKKK